jgi:iron complex transport system permease protein
VTGPRTRAQRAGRPVRRAGGPLVPVGLLALAVLSAVAAGSGAFPIAPGAVASELLGAAGLPTPRLEATAASVLWGIRIPRVVLGIVVGAGLGAAGAVAQGVFRNPLAEPAVIGVSAGAALGAAATIVVGATALGPLAVPTGAFLAGLATTALVVRLATRHGRTEVVTLVLVGIAVNATAGAGIGLAVFLSDDAQLRSIAFWNLGSLASATWRAVVTTAPLVALAAAGAMALRAPLDLLALGDAPAAHLGVDVARTRRRATVVVALLTAAGVAVAGIVSFVGLVVPHLVRLVAGPGHHRLVPASAVLGAVVLVAADLVARTLLSPAELPLGVLTGLVGCPCFVWLLLRARQAQGGWA